MNQTSTPIVPTIEQVTPPTPVRQTKPRLEALDALRGFAACWVAFLCHYNQVYLRADGGTTIQEGVLFPLFGDGVLVNWVVSQGLAVQFFWVLSGFVFAYVYKKTVAERKISASKFFVWRFSRLYPLYWLALSATVCFKLFSGRTHSSIDFLKNATMLTAVIEFPHYPILPPSWSVSTEILAYVAFFFLTKTLQGRLTAYLLPIFASVFVLQAKWAFPLLNRWVAQCLLAFFVGCLAFEVWKMLRKYPKISMGLAVFGVVFALSSPLLFAYFPAQMGDTKNVCIPFVFPLLIIGVLNLKPLAHLLSVRFFRWIGDISFSIYLIHSPVNQAVKTWITPRFHPNYQSPVVWLTYIAVVLALSTLSHYCFEIPVQNKIRAAYKAAQKRKKSTNLPVSATLNSPS